MEDEEGGGAPTTAPPLHPPALLLGPRMPVSEEGGRVSNENDLPPGAALHPWPTPSLGSPFLRFYVPCSVLTQPLCSAKLQAVVVVESEGDGEKKKCVGCGLWFPFAGDRGICWLAPFRCLHQFCPKCTGQFYCGAAESCPTCRECVIPDSVNAYLRSNLMYACGFYIEATNYSLSLIIIELLRRVARAAGSILQKCGVCFDEFSSLTDDGVNVWWLCPFQCSSQSISHELCPRCLVRHYMTQRHRSHQPCLCPTCRAPLVPSHPHYHVLTRLVEGASLDDLQTNSSYTTSIQNFLLHGQLYGPGGDGAERGVNSAVSDHVWEGHIRQHARRPNRRSGRMEQHYFVVPPVGFGGRWVPLSEVEDSLRTRYEASRRPVPAVRCYLCLLLYYRLLLTVTMPPAVGDRICPCPWRCPCAWICCTGSGGGGR